MSTASSPFVSDDIPEVDLILPKKMRSELRHLYGELMAGDEVPSAVQECKMLISVGDVVTYDLLGNGITPRIAIYDGKTERIERTDLLERIAKMDGNQVRVCNPQAMVTAETIRAVKEALAREENTKILVDGEEDLAALVCIALAPLGSCVVYGYPGKGVVLVNVDQEAITIARSLISRMEESH
ncbi:MAG TPA: GTP-dependent dephospho-CoA kinase family protein [Methanomassiliicoccales archaeon]|nr:GTP-dependent dephospho-CoA kinase family protein [Methanomassiliicoccales archaeon]